jgi:hypothetical protein
MFVTISPLTLSQDYITERKWQRQYDMVNILFDSVTYTRCSINKGVNALTL